MLSAVVLPVRLDRAHLHELPGDPDARPARSRSPASTRTEFLLHFAPYFARRADDGRAGRRRLVHVRAFALAAANFWIHILATIYTVLPQGGLVRRDAEEGRGGAPAAPRSCRRWSSSGSSCA